MTIEVFTARRVLTMNPSWPEGTAVAVRDGRILEVGTLQTLQPWLERDDFRVNEQFANQVLLPGFIDPHLHPVMAAVLLPMTFIAPTAWRFPWGTAEAATTPDQYRRRLLAAHRALQDTDAPLFTFGYHALWHGHVDRAVLNELCGARPTLVWQRSFHEVILNDAMLAHLGIDAQAVAGAEQIDLQAGRFFENGLGFALRRLNHIIMSADWVETGLQRLRRVAHHGGHTLLGDMAVGMFDLGLEQRSARAVLDQDDTPFRVFCAAHGSVLARVSDDDAGMLAAAEALRESASDRLLFGNHIKLFTDGAFFGQLAVLQEPGYLDGHLGEWLMVPEAYEAAARTWWHAGYRIHVHCTGDLGLQLAIDTLARLQDERPRFDHGYTIEHFGFSTPEQVARLSRLGGRISANVYYLHELSHAYAHASVGVERAHQMARLGTAVGKGIPVALHSDFPMAPAEPLNNAWVAATRRNIEHQVVAPLECLSVEQALRAITIDAAHMLDLEHEVGSLQAGKRADMVVLDDDPLAVGAEGLKDLAVVATVLGGRVFEVPPITEG